MTSISASFLANATSSSGSSGGSDIQQRVAKIQEQLKDLQKQMKELGGLDLSESAKDKLRKTYQQQIEMLTAELSRLLQQQQDKSDKTTQKNQAGSSQNQNPSVTAAQVAGKTASSQIDLYV